jgi:hypothetical protein
VDDEVSKIEQNDFAEGVSAARVKYSPPKLWTNVKGIFQNVNIFSVLFDRQAKLHL